MANEFQPSLSLEEVQTYAKDLKAFPHHYDDNQKEQLKAHADYYGVPMYTGEFDVTDAVKQLAGGLVEGFTTLNIVDAPDNEYEAIIRNIGHLAGFAPGIAVAPLNAIRLTGLAKVAGALGKKSLPMFGAELATKQAKKIFKGALSGKLGSARAGQEAMGFLQKRAGAAKHVVEGAFHLGTASAISAWQGGVDSMMESFIGGAKAGAFFRLLGNVKINKSPVVQKNVQRLAGSLFMGLGATARGATTPEQVYEYLMGAYFGGSEVHWTKAKSQQFIQKVNKDIYKDGFGLLKAKGEIELHPEFENLDPMVQKQAKKDWAKIVGKDKWNYMAGHILSKHGQLENFNKIVKKAKETGNWNEYYDLLQKYELMLPKEIRDHRESKILESHANIMEQIQEAHNIQKSRDNLKPGDWIKRAPDNVEITGPLQVSKIHKSDSGKFVEVKGSREAFPIEEIKIIEAPKEQRVPTETEFKAELEKGGRKPEEAPVEPIKPKKEEAPEAEAPKKEADITKEEFNLAKQHAEEGGGAAIPLKKSNYINNIGAQSYFKLVKHAKSELERIENKYPDELKGKYDADRRSSVLLERHFKELSKESQYFWNRLSEGIEQEPGPFTGTYYGRHPIDKGIHGSNVYLLTETIEAFKRLEGKKEAPKPKLYVGDAEIVYKKIGKKRGPKDMVPARTIYGKDGVNKIEIDRDLLRKKYDEKAWTKPKVKGVTPLPENAFRNYKEWEVFVIGHEQGHALEGPGPKRGTPEYVANENKLNQYGLDAVQRYRESQETQTIETRKKESKEFELEVTPDEIQNYDFNSDLDVGMQSAAPGEFKIETFVRTKLPSKIKELAQKDGITTEVGINQAISKISQNIAKIIDKNLTYSNEIKSNEVLKELKAEYGIDFLKKGKEDNLAIGMIRNFMMRKNQLRPYETMNFTMDKGIIGELKPGVQYIPMGEPGAQKTSPAGKAINPVTPRTPFDSFMEKYYSPEEGRGFITWESISARGKDGRFIDYEISRFRNELRNNILRDKIDAIPRVLSYKSRMKEINKLVEKEENKIFHSIARNAAEKDHYLFSGKGDFDGFFFAKVHPKIKQLNVKLTNIFSGESNRSWIEKSRKDFLLGAGKNTNKKRLLEIHDTGLLNNVFHQIETINGIEIVSAKQVNKLLKKMMQKGSGFLNDSKGFNKRSQIILTNGFNSDGNFIRRNLGLKEDSYSKKTGELVEGEKLKFEVVPDFNAKAPKKDSNVLLLPNTQIMESTDGGFRTHTKLVNAMNLDGGQEFSGHNKNMHNGVIYKDGKPLGALLLKGMNHNMDKAGNKRLEEKGIWGEIPESVIKQLGGVKVGDIIEIDPSNFKYVLSTTESSHMWEPQKLYKQLSTSATMAAKNPELYKEAVNDFTSQTMKRFYGNDVFNKLLETTLKKPTKESLDKIMDNIDEIGVKNLLEAARKKGNEQFAQRFYAHVLDLNVQKEIIREIENSGEINNTQANKQIAEMEGFLGGVKEEIKLAAEWAKENNNADFLEVYHNNNYFQNALTNWVNAQVLTPKIKNSALTIMRPQDVESTKLMKFNQEPAMIKENGKWKRNDKIMEFYLDESAAKNKYETGIEGIGEIELGKLWVRYKGNAYTKEQNAEIKEFFRAVVGRVPQDSVSGAVVLRFAGFSGREGYGVWMHGINEKFLGGADKDGDKAFVYFGGKGGLSKKTKDFIDANWDEYVDYSGKEPTLKEPKNPKSEKIFGEPFPEGKDTYYDSPVGFFSPSVRKTIASNAVRSRQALGQNSTLKTIIQSAYSIDRALNRATDGDINIRGTRYNITMTPKKEVINGRELIASSIAYSADPYDVFALKPYNHVNRVLIKSFYDFSVKPMIKKGNKFVPAKATKGTVDFAINQFIDRTLNSEKTFSTIRAVRKLNQGLYGRNWASNRKFYAGEKMEKFTEAQGIDALGDNFLPRAGSMIKQTLYREHILKRVNETVFENILKNVNENVGRYDYLKELTGRSTFRLPDNKFIELNKLILERFNMLTDMESVGTSEFMGFLKPIWQVEAYNEKYSTFNRMFDPVEAKKLAEFKEGRVELLEKILSYGEESVKRDLYQAVSQEIIHKMITARNLSKKELAKVKEVLEKADNIKNRSYLKNRDSRNETPDPNDPFIQAGKTSKEKAPQKERHKVEMPEDRAELNKEQIDIEIRKYKDTLTPKLQDLFDAALLGNINRGNTAKKIKRLEKILKESFHKTHGKPGETTEQFRIRMQNLDKYERKKLIHDGAKHNTSVLGWQSKEVNRNVKKFFIGKKLSIFDKSKPEKVEKIVNNAKKKLETTSEIQNEIKEPIEKIKKQIKKEMEVEQLSFDFGKGSKPEIKKILANEIEIKLNNLDKYVEKLVNEPLPLRERNIDKLLEDVVDKHIVELQHQKNIDHLLEIDPSRGLRGLVKGKMSDLPKEYQSVVAELQEHLKFYNNKISHNFAEIVGGILKKEVNTLNLHDYKVLNNYFKDLRGGSFFQKIFGDKAPEIHKRYYWLFPDSVNKEMMKYEIDWLKKEGLVLTKEGTMKTANVAVPTWTLSKLTHFVAKMQDQAAGQADEWIGNLKTDMLFLGNVAEGETLRQIAVRKRELDLQNVSPAEKKELTDNYNKIVKESKYEQKLKNKRYTITNAEGKREELTGEQIVDRINNSYTKFFTKMYDFIKGKGGLTDKDNIPEALKQFIDKKDPWQDVSATVPKINWKKFLKYIENAYNRGEDVSYEFGIDGLRMVSNSMLVDFAKELEDAGKAKKGSFSSKLKRRKIEPTGFQGDKTGQSAGYWARMMTSPSAAIEAAKKQIELIKADTKLSKEAKDKKIAEVLIRQHSLTGDWHFNEMDVYENFDAAVDVIIKKQKKKEGVGIDWFDANQVSPNMRKRTGVASGYSIDATVPETYARNIANLYSKHLSQIYSRATVNKAYKRHAKKWGEELAWGWRQYFTLYVNDALGNPVRIPDNVLDSPVMKVKGTPYAWWADDKMLDRVNSIAKKLGVGGRDLPEGLEPVTMHRMRHWGNLEAQYQMASLLAHPKSMVTNIFGGAMHTVESVGFRTWRNARNLDYLRKINPEWKSIEDLNAFVLEHGVIPEYISYEAGLSKEVRTANAQNFIKDVVNKVKRNPDLKNTDLMTLAKEHGVTDRVRNFAAKFLTVPEKALRRDAFMAHYIQAWESFNGAITDPRHPFLIEMAKKGVKATQFLYSAPFRPAFARTALGKVLTRFQLWSWNSVKFRNDVIRDAKIHGYKQGTPEFERFKRMAQMDLFVFALANAYAYSLFETALPAPWNWFQDTADWMFGDEETRDRAFFGAWPTGLAPLQVVTPPIMRLGPPALRAMLDNDYKKLTDYYIYTMFPFGRLAKDVIGPNNVIDAPINGISKFTGLPLLQAQRKASQRRKDIEAGTVYKVPTPGRNMLF